jgi:hypothetical protein
MSPVPEFIDPVFVKTSSKRSFSVIENERIGLAFTKTGSIISGTGLSLCEYDRFQKPLYSACFQAENKLNKNLVTGEIVL